MRRYVVGRRRHERQPPPGALRQRLRGVPPASRRAPNARPTGPARRQALRERRRLIFDAALPAGVAVGDVLATPVTGAYGHSMGSNYNKVPRPPVVFVGDGDARLVVRRETYEDLLACDLG